MTEAENKLLMDIAKGKSNEPMPSHWVEKFDLSEDDNRNWDYVKRIGRVLYLHEVFAVAILGLSRDEALIMESMNDGMHWTAEDDYYIVDLFCTNMVPLDAVPLLFKTAGIDPIRYHIKDVKEERRK